MDTGEVPIEDGITNFVGKNDSGKTAMLEALFRLNPVSSGHQRKFDDLYDYPRILYMDDRDEIPETTPITATFQLTVKEKADFESKYGGDVLNSDVVKVSKTYDNKRKWEIDLKELVAAKKLPSAKAAPKELIDSCKTVDELVEKLESSQSRTEETAKLIADLRSNVIYEKAIQDMTDYLPKFLYFDNYSTMLGNVSIPYIQTADENKLDSGERSALSFLKLAKVESEEFLMNNYERRKAALEAAAAKLTREVFHYWSQNQELRVELDLDFHSPASEGKEPPYLQIRIRNQRHHTSLNFSDRSAGFVWFFSFLAYFSEFRNDEKNLVLLLDEPGLNLHGAAQSDLLRFIDKALAPHTQLLYTTHSPFMIKTGDLKRIRTVEDLPENGTTVSDTFHVQHKDTILPLQSALGFELAGNLLDDGPTLIVKNPSDMIYLMVMSEYLASKNRSYLDPLWKIVPAGGLEKIPTFLALIGSDVKIAALMDTRTSGNQKVNALVEAEVFDTSKLISLTDVANKEEADVEDLFDEMFYLEIFNKSGAGSVDESKLGRSGGVVRKIVEASGEGFDTLKPASHFLRNQYELLPNLSPETLGRFEKLFEKINKTLK